MLVLQRMLSGFAITPEVSTFGLAHGEFTHHAQILAVTRGMSRVEINLFRLAIYSMATSREQWELWTLFFDSRDPRSSGGVTYWRNRLSPR